MKTTINIKATNVELNNQIKSHVHSRISSLEKFIDATEEDEALFEVEVGKTTTNQRSGKIFRTEINLTVSGQFYRSEAKEKDLNTSTDAASTEIERQLRRSKEKKIDLFRRGTRKIKNILRRRK
jgi:ribosomal subunit interface protein